jgi:hypothetical protein
VLIVLNTAALETRGHDRSTSARAAPNISSAPNEILLFDLERRGCCATTIGERFIDARSTRGGGLLLHMLLLNPRIHACGCRAAMRAVPGTNATQKRATLNSEDPRLEVEIEKNMPEYGSTYGGH